MLRKLDRYVTILVVIFSLLTVSVAAAAAPIEVAVNQSQVMNFYGVQKVAIANPEIADVVVVSSAEVLLVGKSPGTTTLHIWSAGQRESFQIEVVTNDIPIANEIKSIIGLDDLKVRKIGKTIILEGKVNSQYQKVRAEKVAGAYGEKVVNLLEMTKPIQVKIETIIIEIDKEKTKDLGIKWGSFMERFVQGSFGFGQDLGGNYSPIRGILSAMVKDGTAKILSQPNIITLSGENANIMIGGQLPVPVALDDGKLTIAWKDYGIKLDIAPEVNAEGLINSKIKAEVSSLDWNSEHRIDLIGDLNIPPIKMRKAETTIGLLSGQTMAIGGLLANETSKNVNKIPILSSIPVLGKLFSSTSYSRGETELIILVTPSIVNPAEYQPQTTPEMKDFLNEDPLGGTKDGRKNKSSDR